MANFIYIGNTFINVDNIEYVGISDTRASEYLEKYNVVVRVISGKGFIYKSNLDKDKAIDGTNEVMAMIGQATNREKK